MIGEQVIVEECLISLDDSDGTTSSGGSLSASFDPQILRQEN